MKFEYFAKDRNLLRALSGRIDPSHPLSPFSSETAAIRGNDIRFFREALDGAREKAHPDLSRRLPDILWMYQMGLLLFWIYDRSPGQQRTRALFEKTLGIVSMLIRFYRLPLLKPLRRLVRDLIALVYGEEGLHPAT